MTSRSLPLALIAGLCVAGVGIALVAQYRWNMPPCPWCTLQRLIYVVIAVVALVAWFASRSRGAVLAGAALTLGLALAGLASALYQHFVASATESCALTLADRVISALQLDDALPQLFKATATCDQANVALAGVPFAVWSALLFGLLAVLAVRAFARPAQRKIFR